MFKKITIILILLFLSSCWTINVKEDIKQKDIIDNKQKVEEKWLWTTWGTGEITVSSWFTK